MKTLEDCYVIIAKLRKENEEFRKCHESELGVCFNHCDEIKQLKKENERLEKQKDLYYLKYMKLFRKGLKEEGLLFENKQTKEVKK